MSPIHLGRYGGGCGDGLVSLTGASTFERSSSSELKGKLMEKVFEDVFKEVLAADCGSSSKNWGLHMFWVQTAYSLGTCNFMDCYGNLQHCRGLQKP